MASILVPSAIVTSLGVFFEFAEGEVDFAGAACAFAWAFIDAPACPEAAARAAMPHAVRAPTASKVNNRLMEHTSCQSNQIVKGPSLSTTPGRNTGPLHKSSGRSATSLAGYRSCFSLV